MCVFGLWKETGEKPHSIPLTLDPEPSRSEARVLTTTPFRPDRNSRTNTMKRIHKCWFGEQKQAEKASPRCEENIEMKWNFSRVADQSKWPQEDREHPQHQEQMLKNCLRSGRSSKAQKHCKVSDPVSEYPEMILMIKHGGGSGMVWDYLLLPNSGDSHRLILKFYKASASIRLTHLIVILPDWLLWFVE